MPQIDTTAIRTSDLCHLLGITDRRLRQLVQDGLPKRGRGVYDLAEVLHWYHDLLRTRGNDKSLDEQRKELLVEQTEKTRLENEKMRRDMVSLAEVQAVFNTAQVVLASMLDAFGRRMAVPLAGNDDENAIEGILFAECREVRRAYAASLDKIATDFEGGSESAGAPATEDSKPVRRRRKNPATRKPRARKVAK